MTELSLLVKATIVLASALAATRVAQRSTAAVRALILTAMFAALLILPIVALAAHEKRIELRLAYDPGSIAFFADDFGVARPPTSRSSASADVPEPPIFVLPELSTMVRAAWAAGFILLTAPVAIALLCVRRLRSRCVQWSDGAALVERLARQDGITRRIELLLHGDIVAPMTCGVRRPAIVLPIDAPAWPERELRHALAHELEHVRRADWSVHILARIVCAIYWFHPLVWIAWHRLRLESERACDDAVLDGSDRTAYAEQLVSLARRLSRGRHVPLLSMADHSNLTTRITAVLDSSIARGRPRKVHAAAILSAAIALAAAIAPLGAVIRSTAASLQPAPPQAASTHSGPVEHFVIERADRASANDAAQAPAGAPQGLGALIESPTTGPDAPRFEVASIKPHKNSGGPGGGAFTATGQVRTTNSSLRFLIRMAYGLRMTDVVVGGPDWIDTDGFDVDARPEEAVTVALARLMLRTLLAERFKLVVRREPREMPIYALTLARADGQLGPQIQRPVGECVMVIPGFAQAGGRSATSPPDQAGPGPQPPLGRPGRRCGMGREGPSSIKAGSTAMTGLITLLTPALDRPVIDRTGLTGTFDFDLRYAGAQIGPGLPGRGRGAALPSPGGPDAPTDDAPSIFTALREQLGLALESARGPVDVLVVERVEPPTEN